MTGAPCFAVGRRRMNRFFIDERDVRAAGQISIKGRDAAHIALSLRLRAGAFIEVVLGGRLYRAQLAQVAPHEVSAFLSQTMGGQEGDSPLPIHLYQALPKGDKFDFVVQKATELGVASIRPVLSERVVIKVKNERIAKRRQRWQRIAEEAAKQSRRFDIPQVLEPVPLFSLPVMSPQDLSLVAWEEGDAALSSFLRGLAGPGAIHILVGPEGGFSQKEIGFLRGQNWRIVSLGERILRTETASIALLAIIQYELGDMGGGRRCLE